MSSVQTMDVDFADPEFINDPWETLEMIRAQGPVVYNNRLQAYMVPNYKDAAAVLGNEENFTTELMRENYSGIFGGNTMQFDDADRHDRIKAVWAGQFRRDQLAKVHDMITDIVDARLRVFLDRLRSEGEVDACRYLTWGVPTLVISRMMGLDERYFDDVSRWSDAMGGILGAVVDPSEEGEAARRRGREATQAMNTFLAEVVRQRREEPTDDLVGRLVSSDMARDEMSERDIVASVTQLVFAGNETTANLMAITLAALAQYPDQRRMLVEDPSLIPAAVEELNRWQGPVTLKSRHARGGDAEIAGVEIPDGSLVLTLQISANRDPQRWERPDVLDISRKPISNLGFGFGKHVCLGLNLARLEMTIWLERLLVEFPEWEVTEDIDFGRNFWVRGPNEVKVAVP